ncbi:MAG: MBL fold metallo-hydrolase [Alphaproteobacteria bacterium]|nr:MAG: MBL fold metallo-hydrolase [Alphaproteobacteria bacterium]
MKLTFLGATGTVTGSRYLLEDDGRKFLVDCGLFQGLKELRLRNWEAFSIPPSSVDAILLTHAHLDHSGFIPRLVKEGFRGPVYCSPATYDLCSILLPDSGYLQEEDAARANRHDYSKHKPALPLYTEQEARKSLEQFRPVDYAAPHRLNEFLEASFHRAGHILGASCIHFSDGATSILFSGDLGRQNDPVMKAPVQMQGADYVVVESTYGDRLHSKSDPAEDLEQIVNRTVKRGGSIIIPAFAVGRAQSIMYYLHRLRVEKRIPGHLPIYLDSPMAINAAELLHKYPNDHRLPERLCKEVCDAAEYVRTTEESRLLDDNAANMPCVIISASGMATGGRILHHLKRFLGDARNTILLAGYQAEGTRGDRLARGEKEIKIHGQMRPVRAEIVKLDNMSAHADYAEVLEWLGHFTVHPRKVFVTHGESSAAESLAEKIRAQFGWEATTAEYAQQVML